MPESGRWLITGVAGFIGSNLLERLLLLNQEVIGVDNFATGFQQNLDSVCASVGPEKWANFNLIRGDITDLDVCRLACQDVDYVLHQAALGSVPRSIEDPLRSNEANVLGSLNMMVAAKDSSVQRFVYAASSSAYGDSTKLPKQEDDFGRPLSPYAVSKYVSELYAHAFKESYGFAMIGLRYFNVFGRRQNPNGDYAAVIPRWIGSMLKDEDTFIFGDGETSRDFCYIDNVIQANLLAAVADTKAAANVYNIAFGEQTSLNELHTLISRAIESRSENRNIRPAIHKSFRAGDVKHSLADISKAKQLLNYDPMLNVVQGIEETVAWYLNQPGGM